MRRWQWLGLVLVPAGLLAARLDAAELLHTVVKGETLSHLCRDHSALEDCWSGLQRLNGIRDVRRIPVGTVIRIPAAWLKEPRIVGGVLETNGTAQYKALATTGFVPLRADEPVYLGDQIRTADGTAVLEFLSGLMILLRPDSLVLLESTTDEEDEPVVNLALDHGGMEVAMPETADAAAPAKPYSVATPVATAGIAGSARLDAGADGSSIRGETLRGTVRLTGAGGTTEVPEGYAAAVSKDGSSAPRALLPAPAFVAVGAPASTVQWSSAGTQTTTLVGAMQALLQHAPQADGGSPAPDVQQAGELAQQLRRTRSTEVTPDSLGDSFQPARLAWEGGGGAQEWHLDVATAPRGRSVLASFYASGSGLDLPALNPGCYVLELRGVDADGFQGRETRRTVCLHPPLAAPEVPSLTHSTDLMRRIEWPAVEHAAGYFVEVAEDEHFSHLLLARESAVPAIELPRSGGRVEFVRVRAFNAAGLEGNDSGTLRLGAASKLPPVILGVLVLGVLLL